MNKNPVIELTETEIQAVNELCEQTQMTGRDLAVLFLKTLGVYTPSVEKAS